MEKVVTEGYQRYYVNNLQKDLMNCREERNNLAVKNMKLVLENAGNLKMLVKAQGELRRITRGIESFKVVGEDNLRLSRVVNRHVKALESRVLRLEQENVALKVSLTKPTRVVLN